jgi:hypothetical protein
LQRNITSIEKFFTQPNIPIVSYGIKQFKLTKSGK